MSLAELADYPVVGISPDQTAMEAVALANANKCDVVMVLDGEQAVGILTWHDIMRKVVLQDNVPHSVKVASIMTTPVYSVAAGTPPETALQMMMEWGIQHLPLRQGEDRICGIVSLGRLLLHVVEDLRDDLTSVEAFINADGPGG